MPKIDTTQVVCVAEFHAKEGKTDELIAALHVLMQADARGAGLHPLRAEPARGRSALDHIHRKMEGQEDLRRALRHALHHALLQ